ncbi:FHA domain-containing protein [Agromyces archimandritae]|uniref:FHA domain-containing protein n=1 Tax=Agromyces archimandritae TaxID=2781962 RepID=A0A975INP1_9MICO|nr:FHA domain-containing protein [Agromyces archimandritae]QTX04444.1 FHA domain-containing protein [Agromyces archimandritae]
MDRTGETGGPGFIVPPPGLLPPAPARERPAEPPAAPLTRPGPAGAPEHTVPHRGGVPVPPAPPGVGRPPGVPVPVAPPFAGAGGAGPAHPHPARRWRLVRDGGAELPLDGPLVIGRDPVLPAHRPEVRAIRIADPANSVSKTHALIEPGEHGVAVTDLHSTNGVSTASADGEIAFLEPEVPRIVTAGAVLRFGEFEVTLQHA